MSRAQIRISDDINFLEGILNSGSPDPIAKSVILKKFYDERPQFKGIYKLKRRDK